MSWQFCWEVSGKSGVWTM